LQDILGINKPPHDSREFGQGEKLAGIIDLHKALSTGTSGANGLAAFFGVAFVIGAEKSQPETGSEQIIPGFQGISFTVCHNRLLLLIVAVGQ
jgi:hypothetical protein